MSGTGGACNVLDSETLAECEADETIKALRQERGGYKSVITRKQREIREMMWKTSDVNEVQHKLHEITGALHELNNVHTKYVHLLKDNKNEIETAENYREMVHEQVEQIRDEVRCWGEQKQDKVNTEDTIKPEDSVSQTGRSSTTSTSSLRLKAKAHKAALLVQAEGLKKRQELKQKQLQIEQETERLALDSEIAATEAEEKVYADYCSTSGAKGAKPRVSQTKPDLRKSTSGGGDKSVTHGLNPLAKPFEHTQDTLGPTTGGQTGSQDRTLLLESVQQQRRRLKDLGKRMDRICQQTFEISHAQQSSQTHTNMPENAQFSSPETNHDYQSASRNPTSLHSQRAASHSPYNVYTGRAQSHSSPPVSFRQDIPPFTQIPSAGDRQFMRLQQTMLDAIHMPRAELVTFDGDPLAYWAFVRSFESCVDNTDLSDAGKLTRLFQYCRGKAREVIGCCAIMEPTLGYSQAKRLLFERFGNRYTISKAWVSKITEGDVLKASNAQSLREFADDVKSCVLTLDAMGRLAEVDNQTRMLQIVERLPYFLKNQWRKQAVRSLRENGDYPNISELLDFIELAAQEATDPVFGETSDAQNARLGKPSVKFSKTKGSVFNVQAQTPRQNMSSDIKSGNFTCHYCNGLHPLVKCETFGQLAADKRYDFVRGRQLCFNCFSIKHWSNNCNKDSRCSVNGCKKAHSRLLHDHLQNEQPDRPVTGLGSVRNGHIQLDKVSTGAGIGQVALPIVSVRVKAANNDYVETFALLDTGSTNTFCSKELLAELGISGKLTRLSLSTLEKQDSKTDVITASLLLTDSAGRQIVQLPKVFATSNFPLLKDNYAQVKDIRRWPHLADLPIYAEGPSKVNIIIGQDVPDALTPFEVRRGNKGEPYATRTLLGWAVNGPVNTAGTEAVYSNFLQADEDLTRQVEHFWKLDTCPDIPNRKSLPMSKDDARVISFWEATTTLKDGHYQMRIPFRKHTPDFPNNYSVAEYRLLSLGRTLSKDTERWRRYCAEIDSLLQKGYAERVSDAEITANTTEGKIWYLPHHGVTNINKPEKLRVVFDCAALYNGVSLNNQVLQGPDLSNKLLGVLLRFRENEVAIMGDIEAMFHQVRVHPDDRDVLRFLWWRDGDLTGEIEVYRMTVHLFGGVWSPSCASFALKLTADVNKDEFDNAICKTVMDNFYVDDCLKSVATSQEAVALVEGLCSILQRGGFRLNKWISNDRTVLESIPVENRAKCLKEIAMDQENLPVERALGVRWDTEKDEFGYNILPKDRPFTRRGLLSVMTSVYDPLGFASPYILLAKRIFQNETKRGKPWDSPMEEASLAGWKVWLQELPKLETFRIPRCHMAKDIAGANKVELHHFADGSTVGYGAVSYLRLLDEKGNISCNLLLAKSRLAPLKTLTIPRLELTAAVLAVKMDTTLRRELDIEVHSSKFWTDSEIVLRYIYNEDKRFQTFVANRLSQIHESSTHDQWNYVSSSQNPADDASRGLSADNLLASERWKHGPSFLTTDQSEWPVQPCFTQDSSDLEIKRETKVCVAVETSLECPVTKLVASYSSWYKLKKAVAWILRLRSILIRRVRKFDSPEPEELTVSDLRAAEEEIIKMVQKDFFSEDIRALATGQQSVRKTSSLIRLEPFRNNKGVLCVGGRLSSTGLFHQMIIPKDHLVGSLIIRYYHEVNGHCGKEFVLSQIRHRFWIIRARRQVERVLRDCVSCKKRQKVPDKQRMADLPSDRTTPFRPPFTDVGVDCFGPFLVKRGRVQVKRYGCIFTCLTMRAIHLEKLDSLSTDSFINGLKRFESRRGRPERIRSDNGTNFVSGERELREGIRQWNQATISEHLRQREIQWIFNPPCASHMGGSWERQIRTVRKVLKALLSKESGLDDEGLSTLFCQVEAIVNNRPITVVSDDPKDPGPLTPNHLLLLRSVPSLPSGVFTTEDQYRKQWRHVQQLSNVFWKRWISEYLPTIQFRQKWFTPMRNLREGDIVLVLEENTPRGNWPLGRITRTHLGGDGLVRSADVRTRGTVLTRPTNKLCLLESIPE